MLETDESDNPELQHFISENHKGLLSIELRRKGKGAGIVKRYDLRTVDGVAPKHDQTPADTVDDIVSTVLERCEAHATKHGRGEYKCTAQLAKKATGPAPDPRTYTFTCGVDGVESSNAKTRELAHSMLSELWGKHLALLDKTTAMVSGVATIVTSLASAHSQLFEGMRQHATATTEGKFIESQAVESAARTKLAERALVPFLDTLRRSWLGKTAELPAGATEPTLVERVKKFVASLRGGTMDDGTNKLVALRAITGETLLASIEAVTSSGDVCKCMGELVSMSDDKLFAALGVLDAEQSDMLNDLQDAARRYAAENQAPAAATSQPALAAAAAPAS
jgi:hypothetical protein